LVCGYPPEGLQELNYNNMPTFEGTPTTISLFYNDGEFISANNVIAKVYGFVQTKLEYQSFNYY